MYYKRYYLCIIRNEVITIKAYMIMKRYYVNGKEISEQEAKAIEAKNREYMSSTDFSLWAKCQFIVVVNA